MGIPDLVRNWSKANHKSRKSAGALPDASIQESAKQETDNAVFTRIEEMVRRIALEPKRTEQW